MRISHSKKFVFLANPRTASTTIRNILDPYAEVSSRLISEITPSFPFYHHISARELKAIFQRKGWNWDDYRVFCVVRNPYDRMISLYRHQQKIYRESSSVGACRQSVQRYGFVHATKMAALYLTRPRTFDAFLRRVDTRKSLTTSLKEFAFDEAGRQLVTDILMFENLAAELPALLHSLGIEVEAEDIPHLNAARREVADSGLYTAENRQIMLEKFGYEIERFGYEPV